MGGQGISAWSGRSDDHTRLNHRPLFSEIDLNREGGWSNHRKDSGSLTPYGMSQRALKYESHRNKEVFRRGRVSWVVADSSPHYRTIRDPFQPGLNSGHCADREVRPPVLTASWPVRGRRFATCPLQLTRRFPFDLGFVGVLHPPGGCFSLGFGFKSHAALATRQPVIGGSSF